MNKSKSWLKISIQAESAAFEALDNYFFEMGCSGTEEKGDCIIAYFPDAQFWDQVKSSVLNYVSSLRTMNFHVTDPEISELPEEDWSVQWHRFFRPVEVTSKIVIKPPWETWVRKKNEIVVDINPQMAFGTGTHESTQICLQLLEGWIGQDDTVLDVGTGSGILGITAIQLGAKTVTAVEIDEDALPNAKENAVHNGTSNQMKFICGTIDSVPPAPFDLILANINRLVLEKLIPKTRSYIHRNSHIILSGVLIEERDTMRAIFRENQFRIVERITRGEWDGYVIQ